MQTPLIKEFAAFDVLVIAASAGGISALGSFLSGLPACFPAPIVVAQHLAPRQIYTSYLDRVLQRWTKLQVKWAGAGEQPLPGTIYLVPQDKLAIFTAKDGFLLTESRRGIAGSRLTADALFRSAAQAFGNRALALVLSGTLQDGADGALEIARLGGQVLAQSYSSADFADMPRAAMRRSQVGLAFDPETLAHVVVTLVMAPGASGWFRVGKERGANIC